MPNDAIYLISDSGELRLAANRNMTFSSHTLLFEPHSHRFFGKRFGRFLPMDGIRSRIVLPNLSGGHAREIRQSNY